MCSTESRADADLPLGRSALASHACTHLILGPHGSFDGSTRNEQPSACGYSCPHDPIARGTSTSRQASPVDASRGTRGAADRPQGSDGVAPAAETLPADTAPRRATHAVAARARGIAPRRNSIASRHTRSTTPDRYAVHPFCSGVLLPIRCAAPDQVRCSRSGAVPARRHRQAAEALPADTASRRATHAALHPIGMQYTLSVQVYCSRSGALLPIRCCACTQARTSSGGAVCERPRECSRAGIGRRPRQIRPEPLPPNREAPPPPSERPRGQSPIPSTGLRDPTTIRVTV